MGRALHDAVFRGDARELRAQQPEHGGELRPVFAIAPAVKDGALHVDGEAIELNAENSRKVAAAVSRLRRAIPGRTVSRNPIEDLRRLSIALVQEFEAIARKERDGENWPQLTAVLRLLRSELTRIAAENGVA